MSSDQPQLQLGHERRALQRERMAERARQLLWQRRGRRYERRYGRQVAKLSVAVIVQVRLPGHSPESVQLW